MRQLGGMVSGTYQNKPGAFFLLFFPVIYLHPCFFPTLFFCILRERIFFKLNNYDAHIRKTCYLLYLSCCSSPSPFPSRDFSGFHNCLYGALSAIRDKDQQTCEDALERGHRIVAESLHHASLESIHSVYPLLDQLQALKEMHEVQALAFGYFFLSLNRVFCYKTCANILPMRIEELVEEGVEGGGGRD